VAWEVRHGRRVYVRSTRSGDKVRHENFGTGPAAEAAAALDERRRREREANRDAREKRRQEWDETSAPLRKLADGTDLLLAAKLLELGYHRHSRGRWRARRQPLMATADSTNAPPPPPTAAPDVLQVLGELKARAEAGDTTAVEQIGRVLDAHPDLWRRYGDLARDLRSAWLRLAAGGELLKVACVRKYVAEMERELTGPAASRLEKLLAERVIACWLQLQLGDAEAAVAAKGSNAGLRKDAVARQALAERMFEKASKALATHQALVKPRLSPIDLAQPVAETAPAARRSEFESSRRMVGVASASRQDFAVS
jgi:hypothetical protein